MGIVIRKIISKAAAKVSKVDATDAFTQFNVDDAISIIKAILF